MPRQEREPSRLPKELADFLKNQPPYACVTERTNLGTVLVIKAPNRDIQSARSRVPIHVEHQLFDHPSAPVIRMTITIYDQPKQPLAMETFINVEDERQRADYAALAKQRTLHMLFYDETLNYRLTKGVGNGARNKIVHILTQAHQLLSDIPKSRFDFDRAKAEVMRRTRL